MVSYEALQLILEESETMIVEWADTKDGYGLDVIEKKLNTFFDKKGITDFQRMEVKYSLRQFIVSDMKIFDW